MIWSSINAGLLGNRLTEGKEWIQGEWEKPHDRVWGVLTTVQQAVMVAVRAIRRLWYHDGSRFPDGNCCGIHTEGCVPVNTISITLERCEGRITVVRSSAALGDCTVTEGLWPRCGSCIGRGKDENQIYELTGRAVQSEKDRKEGDTLPRMRDLRVSCRGTYYPPCQRRADIPSQETTWRTHRG